MTTQRKVFADQGRMIKPPLVAPNNWVLLKNPKPREPDVVPIISRSQRRKIQRRYTQYQKDLKENGESTSMAQAKDQTDGGIGSKPIPKIKRSASME